MANNYQAFLSELAAEVAPKKLGATTREEQVWCRWFGREAYRGLGALIEWGPWLGSLTASYCEGLEKNRFLGGKNKFVHVYDLFQWSEIFENWSTGTRHAGRFREGDDFRDYFCELHRAYEPFLNVHEADLSKEVWSGQPIEWIINDAVKSLEIGANVFKRWVPCMIPGNSYIAHQDYLWSNNSFIQVYMYLLRESFTFEHAVPGSCMVVFKNIKQCDPRSLAGHGPSGNTLTEELIDETFEWSRRVLGGVNPKLLALCHSATLRDFGFIERARQKVADQKLANKTGDPLFDFQLDTLLAWGYADVLSPATVA